MTVKKVIIVTNIPNPYRIPLFNEVNKQFEKAGIKLKVLFGSLGYSRRQYKIDMNECHFEYSVLNSPKFDLGDNEKTYFTYKGLVKAINREKPDAIIVGGYSVVTIRLWLRSLFRKTRYIIWSGSVHREGYYDSRIRRIIRKIVTGRAVAFIAYGSKAKEYLVDLGAEEKEIFIARNTVDTKFFQTRTDEIRSQSAGDGTFRFTYVGFITLRKNLMQLMEAVKLLAEKRKDFVLDLVGEGNDKPVFEAFIKKNGLEEMVNFIGFVQKSEVPVYLARSSCFIFPSEYDIWGLVVNEAMAAALPCISSKKSGVTVDLVKDGETGFAVDFSDTAKVVEVMNHLLDHPDEAKRIGRNAREFLQSNASIPGAASAFLEAIRSLEKD
ncbi:MAG: glycosyltransferase family 4 protein [Bacteroidetes bacterium]|nr:glycosyltransferase family 4 protein [Bacteroidota bacterium]